MRVQRWCRIRDQYAQACVLAREGLGRRRCWFYRPPFLASRIARFARIFAATSITSGDGCLIGGLGGFNWEPVDRSLLPGAGLFRASPRCSDVIAIGLIGTNNYGKKPGITGKLLIFVPSALDAFTRSFAFCCVSTLNLAIGLQMYFPPFAGDCAKVKTPK